MLIPIRQLADNWPGRLALLTGAFLATLAFAAAVVVSQSGATAHDAFRVGLFTYFAGSMVLGAPAMFVGLVVIFLPRIGGLGASLMMYGAAMGALGYAALVLAFL